MRVVSDMGGGGGVVGGGGGGSRCVVERTYGAKAEEIM